jgi:MoaA/NifB/PqqE/SkfB family radical SAM enzyme
MIDKIKWLHVEPTTRCNAWCSSCPRNNNGFGLSDRLILADLKIERLKLILDSATALEHVIFCGNYGDPCASKIIDEQLKLVKDKGVSLQFHTNGSLRTTSWWNQLAKLFEGKIEVWFGIDGMEDTHSIYRQGTNWQKIIDNASAFINAGGRAVWQFIPFAHNEHQATDCLKLSQKLGFKEFRFIKDARYRKKSFHYKTGKEIDIKPWSGHNLTWKRKRNGFLNNIQDTNYKKNKVEFNDCVHLVFPSLFLNAQGTLTPCCMYTEQDIKNFDIQQDFDNKNWKPTCLSNCGS